MFRMNLKQMLSVFLAILMLRPFPMQAAPTPAVLGSISSYGAVTVGDLSVPAEHTLFAGDLVSTRTGSAVIQYKEGTRVLLTMDSSAQFTPSAVQLQKGQMTFRSSSVQGPVFQASSLRLEPTVASSSANVVLNDGKASVAVTEGAVRVVDPTGAPLASIQAGEARLFAMASAAAAPAAPPAASAAAPQAGGDNTVWLLALGVAAAGASLGIAGLIRANNANDSADASKATLATLQTQNAALQTSLTKAIADLATLRAQVSAFTTSSAQLAAIIKALDDAQTQANVLHNQVNALQAQINAAIASGNTSQLNSLIASQNAVLNQLTALQTTINNLTTSLRNFVLPGVSPTVP